MRRNHNGIPYLFSLLQNDKSLATELNEARFNVYSKNEDKNSETEKLVEIKRFVCVCMRHATLPRSVVA